ncbi:hypothetical protein DIZ76_011268 [Coccidioides immitis]|nr:hypothetical protein DIZ76_011268 [Coccidioides immitis]
MKTWSNLSLDQGGSREMATKQACHSFSQRRKESKVGYKVGKYGLAGRKGEQHIGFRFWQREFTFAEKQWKRQKEAVQAFLDEMGDKKVRDPLQPPVPVD